MRRCYAYPQLSQSRRAHYTNDIFIKVRARLKVWLEAQLTKVES